MLQIQIIEADSTEELTKKANEFLATIDDQDVKNVSVNVIGECVIQYLVEEAWKDRKCYDCKYWDDGGDPEALIGFCRERGGRKKYLCNACNCFKDIRG